MQNKFNLLVKRISYKIIISSLLILFLLSFQSIGSWANSSNMPISIFLNNQIVLTETAPFIMNSRTFVPLRTISESLGVQSIEWNPDERSVFISDENKNIKIFIDQKVAIIDEQEVNLEVAPIIVEQRTMVPVRFIAENFNCTVNWDNATYSVMIQKSDENISASSTNVSNYSQEDLMWLSRIVHVEAMDLNMEGKLAIANVVLNRVKSSSFPNSVYDVIFEVDYYVQFPPAHKSGFTELVPSEASIEAAKLALSGNNNIEECLFFNNVPFSSKQNDLYTIIDGEYFYK